MQDEFLTPSLLVGKFMKEIQPPKPSNANKVTIVGSGATGTAAAIALLTQGVTTELVLCDINLSKSEGEALDMLHGSPLINGFKVGFNKSGGYEETAGSKICVITAGLPLKVGETRLQLLQKNADIFKGMIPELVKYSPDCILIILANPVDVLTYLAWKISKFPKSRCFGTGCHLDSARFRLLISQKSKISCQAVSGFIIGEHGDTSVPVWSSVTIAGIPITSIVPKIGTPDDDENWKEVHKQVVEGAYYVTKLKNNTCWAVGIVVADLCKHILGNSGAVCAISTSVKGMYGITNDVFLSVPCCLGWDGITNIVEMPLSDPEVDALKKSADVLFDQQSQVEL